VIRQTTLVGIIFIISSCSVINSTDVSRVSDNSLTVKTQTGYLKRIEVELAITPQQMATGLMHRTQLNAKSGMLFVFEQPQLLSFWMRDTLIPLDIIFITSGGLIQHIHPMAKPGDLTRIFSKGTAKAVLEINGGESELLGLQIGDKVYHPLLSDEYNH